METINKELEIAETSTHSADFSEVGRTGLNRWGGYVYQEFLPNLRWPHAAKIYQEMSSNDPVIGAILYVSEQLIRGASWRVVEGGPKPIDAEAKEFLESCLNDMSSSWIDTIAEILTMLTYGWAWHEIVYKRRQGDVRDPKRRSKYSDARIGWRKIPGRAQTSMFQWIFDEEDDGIIALEQQAPPDYKIRTIPLEKSLLFRTKAQYNDPEGRSLLRNTYRPWYFKKHIEEIEGIGIERDLAGLPVLIPPEGVDLWNINDPHAKILKDMGEKLVRNIRRDQNEGILLPTGWELKLLSTGSKRQFDTNAIINRYDQRIAVTLLADIVMLGADKVGSFALAEVKSSLLGASLEAILENIAEIFNRHAIPRLFKLNVFPGLTDYPTLKPGKIHTPNLTELARYIQTLSSTKMTLFPDKNLESYLRAVGGMPEKSEEAQEAQDAEAKAEAEAEAEARAAEEAKVAAEARNAEQNVPNGDGRMFNGATSTGDLT